jgi:hypothetical protein
MYVSALTDDCGQAGLHAIHAFHKRAAGIGALPEIAPVELLTP